MKTKMILSCLMLLAFQANADEVKTTTEATGGATAILGTVGSCSMIPAATGFSKSMISIDSNFQFLACVEYKTASYNVSGSFWNTKSSEVEGTASLSYKIERRSRNSSLFLMGALDKRYSEGRRPVDLGEYLLGSAQVASQCAQARQQVEISSVSLSQTKCAGQSTQY